MRWKAILSGLFVVLAVGSGLGFYWHLGRKADGLRLPGVVEIQEVRLGSKIGGRVAEVLVAEGELIEEGQVLVRLEAPELEAQRAQVQAKLREAEYALEKAENGPRQEEKDAAQAALELAQAELKRLRAGNRPEEIAQAEGELKTAQANERLAQEDFRRAERLLLPNATTRAEFDGAKAALERARGLTATSQARRDLMKAGARAEDVEKAEKEEARLRANFDLLRAGTRSEEKAEARARVEEMQGKLREIDANLREAVVRAPEPAVVEVLAVRKGDLVAANQPILRVLRSADLWVKVYVPETDLGRVRLNQEVQVTSDTYRDRRFQGKVVQITSESEFTPRNVQSVDERRHQVFGVRVRVDDPQGVFKSGMAAQVFIPVQE